MAPVPKTERRKPELRCEWSACEEMFDSVQAFTTHLLQHAEEFMAEGLSLEKCLSDEIDDSDEYHCQWKDCGYITTEGSPALLRHLLFHGYHTRIKWQGTQERERCKIGACQLDPQSRNIIPELPQTFRCGWDDCTFRTNNADYFYCHVEMHSSIETPKDEIYECQWQGCSVKTKDKYKLRDHLRSHTQEKRFGCNQCGGLFSNRTKFFDHIHRQGSLDKPNYQCSHCSKVFASERLLRDHMRHHVNHYKCPFCDMTCPAPSVLKKHILWRHSKERPFSCDLCSFRAKAKADIRRHMESHNPAGTYQCEIQGCEYTSRSLWTLRMHFRRSHSGCDFKRYICHLCDQKFTRGSHLTNHLKAKHRFKWPSGHIRFRYKEHDDGLMRLQTVRYESIELTQQILHDTGSPAPSTQSEDDDYGDVHTHHANVRQVLERITEEPTLESNVKGEVPESRFNKEGEQQEFQYMQDESGRIVIVNCSSNENGETGEEYYEVQYVDEDGNIQETSDYQLDTRNSPQEQSEAPQTAVQSSSRKRDRQMKLERNDYRLAQEQQSEDLVDGPVHSSAHPANPVMHEFPIEQLQSIQEASDRESGDERSPKRARFESSNASLPTGGSNLSEEERMQNVLSSMADDRMAMAAEAMTNLSRGTMAQW